MPLIRLFGRIINGTQPCGIQVEWGIGCLKTRFKRFLAKCLLDAICSPQYLKHVAVRQTSFICLAWTFRLLSLGRLLQITSTTNFSMNGECESGFIDTEGEL